MMTIRDSRFQEIRVGTRVVHDLGFAGTVISIARGFEAEIEVEYDDGFDEWADASDLEVIR